MENQTNNEQNEQSLGPVAIIPIEDAKKLFRDAQWAQLMLVTFFAVFAAGNIAQGGFLIGGLMAFCSYSHLTRYLEMRRIVKATERFLNGSQEQGN